MAVLWTACAVFIPLLAWKFVACLPVLVAWIQLEQLPHPPRKLLAGNFKPGRLDQPHLQWLKWHKEIGGLFCSRMFWRHVCLCFIHVLREGLDWTELDWTGIPFHVVPLAPVSA